MTPTETQLRVEREFFFHTKRDGTLRFVEHAPADVHETDHDICGCTRNVAERPSGKPDEVRQEITLWMPVRDGMRAEYRLKSNWLVLWLDKPLPTVNAPHPGRDSEGVVEMRKIHKESSSSLGPPAHAYFIFGKDSRVNIEIMLDGYGLTDAFFSHVFMGDGVDVSMLMNGHAPSRIVDPSKLRADDVWLHDCMWGHEAMRLLAESAPFWRTVFANAAALRTRVKPYASAHSRSVFDLRAECEADTDLMRLARAQIDVLAGVVATLADTELYQLTHSLDQELWGAQDS